MFKEFCTAKNITFLILVIVTLLIIPKIVGILLLFFAAFVLASALNPYVEKLTKKMNRSLASTVAIFGGFLAVLAVFIPIFVISYKEIHAFAMYFPDKLQSVTDYLMVKEFYGQRLTELFDLNAIIGPTSEFAHNLFNQSVNITVSLIQLVIVAVAITMILYYLLDDKKYLKAKFLEFFPADLKDKASFILSSISAKVGSYVRAQIISMIAVGVMTMIALMILGIDYPLMLGVISGVLDIIPILGPTLALAVIILVAYNTGLVKIILVIVAFLVVQQLSNYVVRPVLFGKFMKLHPLMVFFSLFITQQFLGIWGVVLAPALAATVCVLIDELYLLPMNNQKETIQSNDE